jgi:hypothetical protein
MVIAADYPFLDVVWSMVVFFGFVIWISLLFTTVSDLLRRHDIGGWGKAGWLVFMIVLPYLGVFAYLVANSQGISDRRMQQAQDAQSQFDSYVRATASSGGAAAEIERAKGLLDSGGITQTEFDALKAKALAI